MEIVLERSMNNQASIPKSGIKYKNLPNRSSAPFESPAKQSGNLHSKIDVDL